MEFTKTAAVVAAVILLSLAVAHGQAGAETPETTAPLRQSFDIHVPFAPAVLHLENGRSLTYELQLMNFSAQPLTLAGLEVLDAQTGTVLLSLYGDLLNGVLARPGLPAGADPLRVGQGATALAYLAVPLGEGAPPREVRHRIIYAADDDRLHQSTTGGVATVDRRPMLSLSPPLRGGPWAAVYDPALERGHRRVVYAVAGRAVIPGRFAIDWMHAPARADVRASHDDGTGLGEDVLAVADGVVVGLSDGVPEPSANSLRPRVSLAEATGNHVILDLGDGRYAFYEHLMPGLKVRVGDNVRRGQVIGGVGSTGSASRPHLHFHIADSLSPLGAEGLPYVLSGFQLVGAYESIGAFDQGEPWRRREKNRQVIGATFPGANVVVMFP
ncbi:MAG: M23 family metallopeptidase [Candidatus Sphingomonas colombiensis]|nr:M23 family metallopeptidase [Sphingomonas sp.]WEK43181.1 MAG: M23 family metallopeptidase [Sphingomonas sp.]